MSSTVSIDNQTIIVNGSGFVAVNPTYVRAVTVNTRSANYLITLTDIGNLVEMTSVNLVISLNTTAIVGSRVQLTTTSTGTTVVPASGASINSSTTAVFNLTQYAVVEAEVLTNSTGTNANWGIIGLGNPSVPVAPSTISLTGSPFTFTASAYGSLYLAGTTLTTVQIKRGSAAAFTCGTTTGCVTVSQNDKIIVTYTGTPTATWLPM
jgi:hypothetical protein